MIPFKYAHTEGTISKVLLAVSNPIPTKIARHHRHLSFIFPLKNVFILPSRCSGRPNGCRDWANTLKNILMELQRGLEKYTKVQLPKEKDNIKTGLTTIPSLWISGKPLRTLWLKNCQNGVFTMMDK